MYGAREAMAASSSSAFALPQASAASALTSRGVGALYRQRAARRGRRVGVANDRLPWQRHATPPIAPASCRRRLPVTFLAINSLCLPRGVAVSSVAHHAASSFCRTEAGCSGAGSVPFHHPKPWTALARPRTPNGKFSSRVAAEKHGESEHSVSTTGGQIVGPKEKDAALSPPADRQLSTKALRLLPALVLGTGLLLTLLRPRHALATMTKEATLSPPSKGLLASAWAGLVAGCLHTLTGPDHLAALAPLCIGRSRLQSAAVGALWGFGHDTGQIIFGLIFLVLKDKLHIELIRTWASRVVGLTLMTIGGVGIYESQVPVAVLAEEAGLQDGGGKQEVRVKNDSKHATTFATGVVYGLQPDALLMILPALALPSKITGAAFLAMFLLGTVLAMGSYTLFLSSCSHALQRRIPGITKNLTLGSSVIAIALGLALIASELFGLNFF